MSYLFTLPKYCNLKESAPQTIYLPFSQQGAMMQRTLCVRATGNAVALVAAIRREVRSLDPNLPIFDVKTFADQINESISRERLVALLSSFFGLFALLLAALGLYGVMAYAVARRTREIGIRMALGARAGDVLWLVLRETLLLVLIGQRYEACARWRGAWPGRVGGVDENDEESALRRERH
jgi:putative ABC transport system permease protein